MLSILVVLSVLLFALQFPSIQTYFSKKAASYLSEQLDAQVEIKSLYFRPFSSISLRDLRLSDAEGTPLMEIGKLEADLRLGGLFQNKLIIERIHLEKSFINYKIYQDSSNLQFLMTYFGPDKKKNDKKSRKLQLTLREINLKEIGVRLVDHTQNRKEAGVDFSNLELTQLSGNFSHIKWDSTSLSSQIKNLRFKEKSGLRLQELNAEAVISNHFMEFDNLLIQTDHSTLGRYLRFSYGDFEDFSDFVHRINIQATLDQATIDSRDIEYFAPNMHRVKFLADVEHAKLQGTVSDLEASNVSITTGSHTRYKGNLQISGLPDINRTDFVFQTRNLQTSAKDLQTIIPLLNNGQTLPLPEHFHRMGVTNFVGLLEGRYNQFDVDGQLNTALGEIFTQTHFDLRHAPQYRGHIASTDFQMGQLLNSETLSSTGLEISFDGRNFSADSLQLELNGGLSNFEFGNYQYDSIVVDALLHDRRVMTSGSIVDPLADLKFDASINFKAELTEYDLYTEINTVNLKRLGWVNKDSIIVFDSNIHTKLRGNTLNNLNGHLDSKQLSMESSKGRFTIEDLYFAAEGNETDRLLTLRSNVLDAEIKGIIDLNTIVPYFKALAMRYAPAISLETDPYNPQIFDLDLNIKSFDAVSAFLDPTLVLEDGTTLEAHFSSEDFSAEFEAFSPFVQYQGFDLQNVRIDERANEDAFSLNAYADKLFFSDSLFVQEVEIQNLLSNDSLLFRISGAADSDSNSVLLDGNIHFANNKPAYIHFTSSTLMIGGESWTFNENAEMRVSKGKVYLKNLAASQGDQLVEFNGILSNQDDQLNMRFSRFNLHSIQNVIKPLGIELDGVLNGDIKLNSAFKRPYLSANISTSPLVYNQIPIGQLVLLADFNPQTQIANLDLQLLDDQKRGLTLQGTYHTQNGEDGINLRGHLRQAELILLQPFLRSLTSDLTGRLNADIQIGGSLRKPLINGTANIETASFMVNYLKTNYSLGQENVLIDRNVIMLNKLTLTDVDGHQAVAEGKIDLSKLREPYIDVDMATNNVMILNTTYKDNNSYYGKAYATGTYRFRGPTSAMDINIKARSEDRTAITIPFNTAMTISDSDFIYFVSPDSSENQANVSRSFLKGMTMNMDLELTPSAEVNLQTDIGSLRGNGTGEVSLRITSLGDFEMFGDYAINSGKFHFTAQDFINKFFDIKQGGTIRWTGSPSGATVNLTAVYQQRTSVGDLYNAAGRGGQDERVLAQADMIIKGTLSQPDVTFDLNFPQNPYVKDELQAYLSDANNVNQQALSLIVRRSFTASSANEIGKEVNNTLLSAGTEIAFNQLNNILSQSLNIDFVDFNIRSLNDASASLRFFDDRLVLTGGIVDRRNIQTTDLTFFSNQVATDAELTYKIRRDGSLMFRAYNRLNTRNILFTPTDDYINAVGVIYRQEFNTLGEFWRSMWIWGRQNEPAEIPALVNPDSTTQRVPLTDSVLNP